MGPEEEETQEELTFVPEEDLKRGLEELLRAMPEYEKGHRYYFGDEKEKYLSPLLARMLSGSENDFQVNLASRVVDAVVDRLSISALNVTVEGEDHPQSVDMSSVSNENSSSTGASGEASKKLNLRVWHDNELDQEAPEVHLTAGYLGDSYLFVWGNPDDAEAVDVFMNSPTTCRVFYDEENPRLKKFAIKRWQQADGKVRVNLYYPHYVIKFVTSSRRIPKGKNTEFKWQSRGEKSEEFRRYVDSSTDENGVMDNPYGRVPFYHFRTKRPYGIPLHKNAYGPQDAITKLVRSQMTVTDFAAFPQRYALGETGVGSDGDEDWLEEEDASPQDLHSGFISGPGRVWQLTGTKEVGQFSEADVDQILKPIDKFIELMAASTGTPMTYLNKVRGTSSTPLSGSSQREMEASHLKKVDTIKRSFAATWRDALSDALEILGHDAATVTVEWDPSYFRDESETWQAVVTQQQAGVPKRQTLMEQGYTAAQVDEWGFTVDEPNGPGIAPHEDPFLAAQRSPVHPELRDNHGKPPAALKAEKAAKEMQQNQNGGTEAQQ